MTYQPHQSEDLTLKCLPDGVPFDKDGNPRKRYVRVEYDGAWCICTPGDAADMIEDDASEEARERYSDADSPDCSYWTPTTPKGAGWLLASIYDTEEGPVALFVRDAAGVEGKRNG